MSTILPDKIGYPPESAYENEKANSTNHLLPNIKLYPKDLQWGMWWNAVQTKAGVGLSRYKNILKSSFDIELQKDYLDLYVLQEGSISDGISNSYGPSFLGSTFGMYERTMIPELIRLSRGSGAEKTISGLTSKLRGKISDELASLLGSYTEMSSDQIKNWQNFANSKMAGMGNVLAGLRLDLPNIWQSSSANMSYSFTIRLYNPDPYSKSLYKQYIIAPIAALMTLATPISADGVFYDRPFVAKVICPGLFSIKEASISNVSIVKGGDNVDIHFNQHPNSVDIRVSFESIYPTMILKSENLTEETKDIVKEYQNEVNKAKSSSSEEQPITEESGPPTLNEYIKNLEDEKTIIPFSGVSTQTTITKPDVATEVAEEDRIQEYYNNIMNDIKNMTSDWAKKLNIR